jgi:LPPG:FO 2-phospho-L-lactate transferase
VIVALAGGVGGSRLLLGLSRTIDPDRLTVIVNTGDDVVLHGLVICPDLDTVTYTLAGIADAEQGWGIAGDTFHALEALGRFGRETWFRLGDRDLATHVHRTALLREGHTLSDATDLIRRSFGVRCRILPMTNDPVRTVVITDRGPQPLQAYLVRDRAQPPVRGVRFEHVERSRPAPGVLEAIEGAHGIVVCPSNPILSIGPILAVPGIRHALRKTEAPVVAVSPVVGGRSLKGPTDRCLEGLGHEVSALGVARLYHDFLDLLVVDTLDAGQVDAIRALPLQAKVARTVMHDLEAKISLAREVLACLRTRPRA